MAISPSSHHQDDWVPNPTWWYHPLWDGALEGAGDDDPKNTERLKPNKKLKFLEVAKRKRGPRGKKSCGMPFVFKRLWIDFWKREGQPQILTAPNAFAGSMPPARHLRWGWVWSVGWCQVSAVLQRHGCLQHPSTPHRQLCCLIASVAPQLCDCPCNSSQGGHGAEIQILTPPPDQQSYTEHRGRERCGPRCDHWPRTHGDRWTQEISRQSSSLAILALQKVQLLSSNMFDLSTPGEMQPVPILEVNTLNTTIFFGEYNIEPYVCGGWGLNTAWWFEGWSLKLKVSVEALCRLTVSVTKTNKNWGTGKPIWMCWTNWEKKRVLPTWCLGARPSTGIANNPPKPGDRIARIVFLNLLKQIEQMDREYMYHVLMDLP